MNDFCDDLGLGCDDPWKRFIFNKSDCWSIWDLYYLDKFTKSSRLCPDDPKPYTEMYQ